MQKLNSTWQYRERKEIHPTRKLKFLFRVIRIQWLENDIWKRLNLFRIFFTRIPSRTKDQLVENTESKIYPTEKTEISFSYDSNFKQLGNGIWKGNSLTIPTNNFPNPILSSWHPSRFVWAREGSCPSDLERINSTKESSKESQVCVYIYVSLFLVSTELEKERRSKSKNRSHVFPVRLRDKRNCCLWASSLCSFTSYWIPWELATSNIRGKDVALM